MRLTHPTGDEAIDLDKVDLFDPVVHAEGDPHAIWLAMRTHDPVHWQQLRPDLGFWSATAFDDVARVLRDHTAFTSEHGTLLNLLGRKDPAGGKQLPATDPPRHTRMRSPIQRALNGRAVEGHRGVIRDEVRRLFDRIVDGEPFDFAALTDQLPMAVIGTLMGLDRDDWSHLTFLTTQAVAPDDPEFVRPEGAQATLHRAHRELFACLQDAMEKRRGGGTGDLIDVLSTMEFEDGGGPLTAGEIVSNCYSLLLGANVTTPHVPNAALAELTATGMYADWAGHPELLDSGIEEALRWSSPTSHFIRYATHESNSARSRSARVRRSPRGSARRTGTRACSRTRTPSTYAATLNAIWPWCRPALLPRPRPGQDHVGGVLPGTLRPVRALRAGG